MKTYWAGAHLRRLGQKRHLCLPAAWVGFVRSDTAVWCLRPAVTLAGMVGGAPALVISCLALAEPMLSSPRDPEAIDPQQALAAITKDFNSRHSYLGRLGADGLHTVQYLPPGRNALTLTREQVLFLGLRDRAVSLFGCLDHIRIVSVGEGGNADAEPPIFSASPLPLLK